MADRHIGGAGDHNDLIPGLPGRSDAPIPLEAREKLEQRRRAGEPLAVTERHLMIWAAIAEVMGVERFDEPLGWSEENVRRHLLLEDPDTGP